MTQKSNTNSSKNYVLPIAIMFALFFMIAFVTGYQNPLGTVIKEMTGGNTLMSQLGNLANFIAYLAMGIPAGYLLQGKGYRKTAIYAVLVGFSGVFITYLSGMISDNMVACTVYLCGALVAGFSMCMLNTVVNPMLNSLGKNQNQGNQLVQFGGTCNSLGATLAPVIVGGLLGGEANSIASANPVFFMAMGIFATAFLVLYFSKLPEAPAIDSKDKEEKVSVSGALRYRNFLFGVVAIFCYVGIEVGIANMTMQYLSDSKLVINNNALKSEAIAGTIVGVYWLLMLVGRLVGGLIGGKVSSRVMLTATSLAAIVFLILGITSSESIISFIGFSSGNLEFSTANIPLNSIFLIACGLCTSVMWGAIYNLSVEGLGKYTAVASGVFMMMVCGGGILPLIQAGIVDAAGSALAGFWLTVGLAAYLLLYALLLSRPSSKLPLEEEDLYEDGVEVKA